MKTVCIDGEERPVDEVPTRCSKCGVGALDFEFCLDCEVERIKSLKNKGKAEEIKEIVESRLYSAGARGRKAEATFEVDPEGSKLLDACIWAEDCFTMEANSLGRELNKIQGFSITIDFLSDQSGEYRKYCRVIIRQ